jgi:hypothetical protein
MKTHMTEARLRKLLARLLHFVQVLALWVALVGGLAGANPGLPTNSYDAHIRNLLLAGKVSEALTYAKEYHGRVPAYLRLDAYLARIILPPSYKITMEVVSKP